MQQNWCPKLSECLKSGHQEPTHHNFHVIKGNVVVRRSHSRSGPGKGASIQLYSSTQVDAGTGRGRLSDKAHLKDGKSTKHNGTSIVTYKVTFHVEPEFGIPGALLIKNRHKHEFFLNFVTLEAPNNLNIHFECKSWVYPITKTKSDRLFFSNEIYLPSQTPEPLRELREEELISLRGDGTGERQEWERIYDYDRYNDLGNPDKGTQHSRPILGGTTYPYPRRGRTGRPPTYEEALTESRPTTINLDIYVPPDERFSPNKMSEFISTSIQAVLHFMIPEAKSLFQKDSNTFQSFYQIRDMFSDYRRPGLESWILDKVKTLVPEHISKEFVRLSKQTAKFPLPQIIAENEMAWKDDEEFGREMLAGFNPAVIRTLKEFPPVSKSGKKSAIKARDIEHNLDGLTLDVAMQQWRIFILDYHDYLMPYLDRINSQKECVYASRTLLLRRDDSTLKPLAIELCLPGAEEGEEISRVFVPATEGTERGLWQLAKAHVAANDSGYHQLVSHWLHTHAVVEPFVIATRRQLSSMHPIHRLLDPHFKDTMQVNAIARSVLLNAEGILERTMFPGKYSLELSSMVYKDWRFDEQALPADLLKRRMAVEDADEPSGVRLIFEDYPYAVDGLEVWTAIQTWVQDYCSIFYPNDHTVSSDVEIQAWWTEIQQVGHGDKRNEKWWYQMNTTENLTQALTTLIWIASALHASVNFGQYAYAGYPPNRPPLCRKFIPEEGTTEFAEFLKDPDKYFLQMLPERFYATLGIALIEVLSTHMSDEVYIGQRASPAWTDNEEVRQKFDKFGENLRQVEKRILERNNNSLLKNRCGPARIPYTLLYPDTSNVSSTKGITGRGIPNSVSN